MRDVFAAREAAVRAARRRADVVAGVACSIAGIAVTTAAATTAAAAAAAAVADRPPLPESPPLPAFGSHIPVVMSV